MPSLVFRNRRLLLGGDELALPYVLSAAGRLLWITVLMGALLVVARYMLTAECEDAGYIALSYELVALAVALLSVLVDYRIAVFSTYGTIIDPGPRSDLIHGHLVYKMILGATQLLLGMVGLMVAFYVPLYTNCGTIALGSFAAIQSGVLVITISQFMDVLCMYCCLVSFTSTEPFWEEFDSEPRYVQERKYEEVCKSTCKALACCTCALNVFGGGTEEADFAHVSRVFRRLFAARQFVDLVATDIAAGLILLRHQQKTLDIARRTELIAEQAPPVVRTKPAETENPSSGLVSGGGRIGGEDQGGQRRSGSPRVGFTATWESVDEAGKTPLEERPWKHSKYYKVPKGARQLKIERGGEDWRILEEVGHFVLYADVMYSVWTTVISSPWDGFLRYIRRRDCCRGTPKRRVARGLSGLSRGSVSRSSRAFFSRASSSEVSLERNDSMGRNDQLFPLKDSNIRGDDWWGSHEIALRAELPQGSELVLAHFKNTVDETPYCVVVDHTWQTIVISIRGSHSFEDFMVDSMAEPCSLEDVGREWGFDGAGMYAHEGILRRTEWIRRDLENSGILRSLLGETGSRSWNLAGETGDASGGSRQGGGRSERVRDQDSSRAPLAAPAGGSFCAGYTVRTVGHSLGGGCAALLAMLLKPSYPTVQALAVSPPGGLVSEGACREMTESMVTSVVLNDDVIPRMSLQSVESLWIQVLDVLARSRVSKLFVMRSLLRSEEEAHNLDLYLAKTDEENLKLLGEHVALSASAEEGLGQGAPALGRGHEGVRGTEDQEEGKEGEYSTVDEEAYYKAQGKRKLGKGAGRYLRQLEGYREHLEQQLEGRMELYRLRLPGRILQFVNTEIVTPRRVGPSSSCPSPSCCCCDRSASVLDTRTTGLGANCWANCRLKGRGPGAPTSAWQGTAKKGTCGHQGRHERAQRRRVFTPIWVSPEDLSSIRVGPAFLVDHNPEEILPAVYQTLRDFDVVE